MSKFYSLLTMLCLYQYGMAQNVSNRNLFVTRIGSGTGSLTSAATAVYLDEYSTSGTLVRAIPLPVTDAGANKKFTLTGTSILEGYPTLSPNGKAVALFGYSASTGTSSLGTTTSASVNRTVAIINDSGTVNTSTALTDAFSAANARSVVYDGRKGIWLTGASTTIRYTTPGSTTSATIAATSGRAIHIYDGQLYMTSTSGSLRLATVGPGAVPIASQTATNLPGFPTSGGAPCQFFFADICSSVPGVDVLYVADNGAGLMKYSLVGAGWTANGKTGVANDLYVGVTGHADGNIVTLYATRKCGTGATGGGELVKITDSTGYNATITATASLLATASSNTAFRGLSFAPYEDGGGSLLRSGELLLTAFPSGEEVQLNWTPGNDEDELTAFEILRSADGKSFMPIGTLTATENRTGAYNYTDKSPLTGNGFYRIRQLDKKSGESFSAIKVVQMEAGVSMQAVYPTTNDVDLLIKSPLILQGTLELYDVSGRKLYSTSLNLQEGIIRKRIPVTLLKGVYLAVLHYTDKTSSLKFIKQ